MDVFNWLNFRSAVDQVWTSAANSSGWINYDRIICRAGSTSEYLIYGLALPCDESDPVRFFLWKRPKQPDSLGDMVSFIYRPRKGWDSACGVHLPRRSFKHKQLTELLVLNFPDIERAVMNQIKQPA